MLRCGMAHRREPASKVDKVVPERARDRVLTDNEIVLFWEAAGKLGWPFGPLFKLLLLTAQRQIGCCKNFRI